MALKERDRGIKIALADPPRRGPLFLLRHRRAEGRGLIDHRGHRPGPRHRQSGGRARWTSPSGSRTGRSVGIVFDLVEREGGGACCWAAPRHQYRRGDPARARTRARPHHRDDPLRFRRALRLKAVQPGIFALESPPRPPWLKRRPRRRT